MAKDEEVKVGSSLASFVEKEIKKLQQTEANLRGSIAKLEKNKSDLVVQTNDLQNKIIKRDQAADQEIAQKQIDIDELKKQIQETLNSAKAEEAKVRNLRQEADRKNKEADSRLEKLNASEAKVAHQNEEFAEKVRNLQEIKKLIEVIS